MRKERTVAVNKRASFDYQLLETYVAGIVLTGQEVKSAKLGNASIKGSYVTIKESEFYLTNAHIPQYKLASNVKDYDPERPRKLLLKKNEMRSLIGKSKEKGRTLVALKLIVLKGKVKLVFALGKGKPAQDKRKDIAKRETKRKIERAIKRDQ